MQALLRKSGVNCGRGLLVRGLRCRSLNTANTSRASSTSCERAIAELRRAHYRRKSADVTRQNFGQVDALAYFLKC
jgi:hypothetical protein